MFAEAPAVGQAVIDYRPQSKASLELRQLTEEVLTCLNQTTAGA
jgi:cellulose biosynthesis protein BcsQ